MSEATLYNWKAKYGGLDVSEAKRLRALEDENAKLKRLLADAMLDAAALKELKNGRPSAGSPSCFARGASASSARREARGRRSSSDGVRDERAAGHDPRRRGSGDDPLSIAAAGRRGVAGAPARSRASAPPLRLPLSRQAIALQLPKGDGCTCCCAARARRPAATRSTGSIAPRVSRCASARPGDAPWASGRRSLPRCWRTRAGRSTSCTTSSPADASLPDPASSTLSTTRHASACSRSPRRRSPAGAWSAN